MLKAYVCLLAECDKQVPEELLSVYRREKLAKQTNPLIRRQSVVSELLLCRALQDSGFSFGLPLPIVTGEYGKPFIKNGDCFFSLSHSRQAVLCALSSEEIGADIQIKEPMRPELIRRCFTPGEQAEISSAPDPDEAFTEIWTMKESFCKYTGQGLRLPINSFSVLEPSLHPHFRLFTMGEYQISVFSMCEPEEEIQWINMEENALFP